MNCEQGDLALVVNSVFNNDRIVRCVRVASEAELNQQMGFVGVPGPYWKVDRPMKWGMRTGSAVGTFPFVPDANLRPIRDQPGADETLAWAPVPVSKPEPVAA